MKKVLIISGTPLRNDTNLGKTLQTMFSKCEKNKLAQLYFSIETPNVESCSTYWQVFEFQLLKSFLGLRSKVCGANVIPETNSTKPNKMPDQLTKNRNGLFTLFAREFLWRCSHWKNKRFKKWLDEFKPEHIFAILSDSGERADTIRWIANKYNCSVTLFVTDDYYHDENENPSKIRKLYFKEKQNHIERMATSCCERIIGCSEIAAEEFGKMFNLPYKTIFTPSRSDLLDLPMKRQNNEDVVIFRYFGNLGLGRWETLRALGETINLINRMKKKQVAYLEVYSVFTEENIINKLNIENASSFEGFVSGEKFTNLLETADIAIHVESFDSNMMRRTRLSISTKIADYLGAAKCILAIGPSNLASIQHIKDEAYIVDDLEKLNDVVLEIINNPKVRFEKQKLSRLKAEKYHNLETIGNDVVNIFN